MVLDILLLLFAGAGFWLGYTKGLVRTLFFIVSYAIALLLTLAISPWIMNLLIRWFHADKMFALIFGTIGTMILMIFLLHWLFKSIEKYLKKSRMGAFSKSFGGVVMMLISMITFSFLLWSMVQFGWIGEKTKTTSYTYPYMAVVPVRANSFISEFKPLFSRYWDLMHQTIREGNPKPEVE